MLQLQRSLGITTLIVTHDQEEAQSLASPPGPDEQGHVEQIDTPTGVYDRPRTLFVNSFIGQANQVARHGRAAVEDSQTSIRLVTDDLLTLSQAPRISWPAPDIVSPAGPRR